ncbi:MAG: hypothetical protein Q8O87_00875 [bacterium]|nr:hypothetical protein [bacterium]
MTKYEKLILKAVVDRGGLLSPADLINGIARQDRRLVENLVVRGYIEEVPQDMEGVRLGSTYTLNFYRATEKGLLVFSPWYTRMWHVLRGDVRTMVIAAITALITSAIAIFVEKFLR